MIVDAIRAAQREAAIAEAVGARAEYDWTRFAEHVIRLATDDPLKHSPLSPSRIGGVDRDRKCLRQTLYRLLKAPRDAMSPRSYSVFENGHIAEAKILADIECYTGWAVHSPQMRVETAPGNWGFIDAIGTPPGGEMFGKDVLIECKSINHRGFQRMLGATHGETFDLVLERIEDTICAVGRNERGAATESLTSARVYGGYLVQVTHLLHGLRQVSDIDMAIIIYKSNDTHALAEFIVPYNEAFYNRSLELMDEIMELERQKTLPARDYTIGKSWQCDYCNYRRTCEATLPQSIECAKAPPKASPELVAEIEGVLAAKKRKSGADKAIREGMKVAHLDAQNMGSSRFSLPGGRVIEVGATTIKEVRQ